MHLNLVQIAESFGVPEQVVDDWIHDDGLPHFSARVTLGRDAGGVPPCLVLLLALWLGLATPAVLREAWTAAVNQLVPVP